MPFTVDWTADADDALMGIWLQATDRNAVSRAQFRIDTILAANPRRGRLLSEGLYVFHVDPLTAYYEIDDASAVVTVTAVAAR